eukprot:TRINITY_DN11084_c0_g1_i4.p1 TRINITY_DN11084_c0_g1~~TRINITY_DN11084_c0_g1_i4.p1  ORF type:complete len:155 (-),score=31.27 TRINITY_DN11084_c0_g1_i4:242-706(-)
MEPKLHFELNQELDVTFNSFDKRVQMRGFSPDYHRKDLKKETNNWFSTNQFHISIPLKMKCIHIWQIKVGDNYLTMDDFPKIKYRGVEWNVICVGFNYSIQSIQSLYLILDKFIDGTIKKSDVEDFISNQKNFDISSQFCIYYGYVCNFINENN